MEEPRISKSAGILMLTVAIFFDVLNAGVNFIPVAGQILSGIISIFAYCSLWFWFSLKGVSLVTGKRGLRFFGASILELIPILNMLPGITLSVLLTITQVQFEDRTRIAKTKKSNQEQINQAEFEESLFEEKIEEELLENAEEPLPQQESYSEPASRDTLEE